jgi:hypothetical protein
MTCRPTSGGNKPSVLLCLGLAFFCLWFSFAAAKSDRHSHASIPQMRTGFGLSAFFLFCALECARVRISPTAASQAESLSVYTGVTYHAKSGGNEPSPLLWPGLAFFDRLWFSFAEAKSARYSQASIAADDVLRKVVRGAKRDERQSWLFQCCLYRQLFLLLFDPFPIFDRAPHQADTLPRRYQSRHALKVVEL